MKSFAVWLSAACAIALLAGCERFGADRNEAQVNVPGIESLPAKPEDVVAVVNGRPITGAMIELYAISRQQQHPSGKTPQPRELTDEVINLELLAEQAEQEGLPQREEIATELYFQRANLLASAMMQEQARKAKIADGEVQHRYEQRYPNGEITEYRTRQILVNDRAEAQRLIGELRSGADFAQLAKARSKGPAAAHGGALEWFKPNDVLPEFATAVNKLQRGEYTRTPVHTTYGWHIILLEDKRQAPAPGLDQVAPQIVHELLTERVEKHIDELRAKAQIEYKRP